MEYIEIHPVEILGQTANVIGIRICDYSLMKNKASVHYALIDRVKTEIPMPVQEEPEEGEDLETPELPEPQFSISDTVIFEKVIDLPEDVVSEWGLDDNHIINAVINQLTLERF
mgnify:CR=1 FL=1